MLDPNTPPHLPVRAVLRHAPPGILQSYAISQRNVLELIPAAALEEPVVSGALAARWHMVMEPQAVRRVLNTRVDDYPKSDIARAVLRPAIGESMIVAEGDEWRRQRRMAAPAFQPRHVTGLGPIMSAAATASVARLQKQVGRAADLLAEMTAATFDVISDVTFSGGQGVDRNAVMRGLEAYGAAAGRMSFLDVLDAPSWVPRPARLRDSAELAEMKALADGTIAARKGVTAEGAPDLLDLLVQAEGPQMSDVDIRDNLLAFIVAGHETTALTLAWALYLCAFDRSVQAQAREEAQSVLGDRIATAEDVARLPYIRAVIDETLRLYPPAAFLSRTAKEPDVLCGSEVFPGDTVTVPVYAIHRHRSLWRNPDAFDPERFLGGEAPDRYTYLPFGDGPRICIGARFAVQEAVIILASLLARFEFKSVPGKAPSPTLIITLRPEPSVWLEVRDAGSHKL